VDSETDESTERLRSREVKKPGAQESRISPNAEKGGSMVVAWEKVEKRTFWVLSGTQGVEEAKWSCF